MNAVANAALALCSTWAVAFSVAKFGISSCASFNILAVTDCVNAVANAELALSVSCAEAVCVAATAKAEEPPAYLRAVAV